ncbi:MAG: glycine betaine ABC transporter substrate-binding protein [Prolixibacteraceae bacterium]|nr:glycine betaine ABC transporter substrate-binding protein [Prolixibacteraceae bacterium]MBN2649151.1 glycine betaine ABC transporter substrate-binding protein [Prolixibacteraceae bacterium]
MKTFRNYIVIALILATALSSCRSSGIKNDRGETLRIVYTDWSEAVAITHLAKVLLEDELQYNVELKQANVEEVYSDLSTGNAHVFADAWLPETHRFYIDKYELGAFDQIGIIYPGARTGLIVPAYSRFSSIDDLLNEDSLVIFGIEAESGVMVQAAESIERYGMSNIYLVETSEAEMLQKFTESYNHRYEIVITGWEPHWLFDRFDVRFLNDPKSVFGAKENISALGCKGLSELRPRAYRFFERMQLSEKQFNRLMYYVQQYNDPEMGVREWIRQNEYVVNQWIKGLKPERMKIM